MNNDPQNYDFKWEDLGDPETARPNLGDSVSLAVYRLMVFTFKDTLSKEYRLDKTKKIFVKAGRQFCRNLLDTRLDLDGFIAALKLKLIEMKIGILRIEQADRDRLTFSLTVSEDLDCSGLPVLRSPPVSALPNCKKTSSATASAAPARPCTGPKTTAATASNAPSAGCCLSRMNMLALHIFPAWEQEVVW